MQPEVQPTQLPEVLLITPRVFGDARGYFKETYRRDELAAAGVADDFVQDNLSYSTQGALRGLHFQAPPHAQAKLVSVPMGRVLDVAVDIRRGSPRYGQWVAVELSDENHRMLYVPAGFAHGFVVLSPSAVFHYKVSAYYNQPADGGLLWNDPDLGIDWQLGQLPGPPVVSAKDGAQPALAAFESPFVYPGA